MSSEKSKRRRMLDPEAERLLGHVHTTAIDIYYLLIPQNHNDLNTKEERSRRTSAFCKAWKNLRQFILENIQPPEVPEDPAARQDREDQSKAGLLTIDIAKERDRARAEVRSLKMALCQYSLDQDRTLRIASAIEERAEEIFKEIQ